MAKGDTRNRIARSALTLFVEQGVEVTTTRQIAERADVAEGTLYRYFESKEGLAFELYLEQHHRIGRALRDAYAAADGFHERAGALVRCYCELADDDWLAFAYHMRYQQREQPRIAPQSDDPVDIVREMIGEAMATGDIPTRDVELAVGMGLGVVYQTALQRLHGAIDYPLTRVHADLAEGVRRVLSTPVLSE